MAHYFSKAVDPYLADWLRRETWDTKHPLDMARFYQFLKALQRYSRHPWLLGFAEKLQAAVKGHHPTLSDSSLSKRVQFYVDKAETVFEYEAAPSSASLKMPG